VGGLGDSAREPAPARSGCALTPSGEQFEISLGDQRATIVEVGGGIREYAVGERAVLDPYARTSMCDGAHGAVLVPWPNRLADGRYSFDGVAHQLALSEPGTHTAIHGLLRWRPWRALEHEPERILMGIRLHPSSGYPFMLDIRVEYALSSDGLLVTTGALNLGERACPYGCGQHPYLSAGRDTIDACLLELPARTRILADARGLPCARAPVAGSESDFREARAVGALRLDEGFTDLERDERGRATSRLGAPDGSRAELWVDEAYPFLQLYSGDGLAPERRRRGLAVEPMSCAANAFQSGEGLVRLEPGESVTAHWGARLA
jgi:aldose 1-epimerase